MPHFSKVVCCGARSSLRRFWPIPSCDWRDGQHSGILPCRTAYNKAAIEISKVTITFQLTQGGIHLRMPVPSQRPLRFLERSKFADLGPPSGQTINRRRGFFVCSVLLLQCNHISCTYTELSLGPCFFAPPINAILGIAPPYLKKSLVNQKNQGQLHFRDQGSLA